MIKIAVIDPDTRTVGYRHVEKLDLDDMQKLVGGGLIEFCYAESRWLLDDFVLNEEGLINRMTPWALGQNVYFGSAFMVQHSISDEGESTYYDAEVKVEHLWAMVEFGVRLQ